MACKSKETQWEYEKLQQWSATILTMMQQSQDILDYLKTVLRLSVFLVEQVWSLG